MTGRTSTAPSQARRDLRGQLDRLVEIGALEQVEARQDLLRLGVRAVAGDHLAAPAAGDPHDRRGRRCRVQRRAAADVLAPLLAEPAVLLGHGGLLGGGPVEVRAVDERCVHGHGGFLSLELGAVHRVSPMRRTPARRMDTGGQIAGAVPAWFTADR